MLPVAGLLVLSSDHATGQGKGGVCMVGANCAVSKNAPGITAEQFKAYQLQDQYEAHITR